MEWTLRPDQRFSATIRDGQGRRAMSRPSYQEAMTTLEGWVASMGQPSLLLAACLYASLCARLATSAGGPRPPPEK